MSKFKVGDQVEIISGTTAKHIGNIGTVTEADRDGMYDYRVSHPAAGTGELFFGRNLKLITKGGDMKPTQRKTYKQLKESVTVKKDALWQEACDDGTQEYVLLNADDNKDPRQTQRIYERALVEEDSKMFVEVFAVIPSYMTRGELDQWEAFKVHKPFGERKSAAKPVPAVTPSKAAEFKVGDRVRVIASKPHFGWGHVHRLDEGKVSETADRSGDLRVDFPAQKSWTARPAELELIEQSVQKRVTKDLLSPSRLAAFTQAWNHSRTRAAVAKKLGVSTATVAVYKSAALKQGAKLKSL